MVLRARMHCRDVSTVAGSGKIQSFLIYRCGMGHIQAANLVQSLESLGEPGTEVVPADGVHGSCHATCAAHSARLLQQRLLAPQATPQPLRNLFPASFGLMPMTSRNSYPWLPLGIMMLGCDICMAHRSCDLAASRRFGKSHHRATSSSLAQGSTLLCATSLFLETHYVS